MVMQLLHEGCVIILTMYVVSCRVFVEAPKHGATDPDWDYIMCGVCFGFQVVDDNYKSCYSSEKFSSILQEHVHPIMSKIL